MFASGLDHLVGKPAPNPYMERNAKRMQKKNRTWFFASKIPIYQYNEIGKPEFAGFTEGVTYKRETPKPLSKKYRRWFKKHHG